MIQVLYKYHVFRYNDGNDADKLRLAVFWGNAVQHRSFG